MATGTVVYKNANLFYAGYNLSGDLNSLALAYAAESLDATVFGNDTRVRKGGLKTASISGGGFWQAGSNAVDPVLFDSLALDDAVAMLFPEAITEGGTSTGSGYMLKVTQARYEFGGAVGDLLPFTVELAGRGAGI